MSLKILQLNKRDSYEYKYIQDKYSYSLENSCYAIADGTTQSFYSELWAHLITMDFVSQPTFDTAKLIARLQYSAQVFKETNVTFSQNPAKASLERDKQKKGGTATFIGIKIDGDQLSIISSGDSNVFIIRDTHFFSYPFTTLSELDSNKYFLNTEKLLSGKIDESYFSKKIYTIESGDIIILATDALSRFFLKNPEYIKQLLLISGFKEFHDFCIQNWDKKLLEEDDITAVIIENFPGNTVNKLVPPEGFSFPRETRDPFTPSVPDTKSNQMISSAQNTISQTTLNPNEMQEMLVSLRRLNEEIIKIKNKSKRMSLLFTVAILLLAVNILFTFYFRLNPITTDELKKRFNQKLTEKDSAVAELKREGKRLKENPAQKPAIIPQDVTSKGVLPTEKTDGALNPTEVRNTDTKANDKKDTKDKKDKKDTKDMKDKKDTKNKKDSARKTNNDNSKQPEIKDQSKPATKDSIN